MFRALAVMGKWNRITTMVILVLLAAGCTPQEGIEAPPDTPEVEIDSRTDDRAKAVPAGDSEMTDSGFELEQSAPESATPDPQPAEAWAGEEQPSSTSVFVLVAPEWLVYTDTVHRFAVAYPHSFVILPKPDSLTDISLEPLFRVGFQERLRASGHFADYEPADFTVEVFELAPDSSLREWLEENGLAPADATTKPYHLAGAGQGWRVQFDARAAPNEHYAFASARYVYWLTPLNSLGLEMLASFQVLSR